MPVEHTGEPLKAPVGKPIPSRMLGVFGNTIDRGPALESVQWRSVHQEPPPHVRRSTKSEVFETGIKAIDAQPHMVMIFAQMNATWSALQGRPCSADDGRIFSR